MGRPLEAVAAYDEVIRRAGFSTQPDHLVPLAAALAYKAHTLQDLNRSGEAIEVYNTLIRRFADSTEPELAEYIAMAQASREEAG